MFDFTGLAPQAHHIVNELPMPSFMFGLIALVLFLLLGFVTWSFRNVAQKSPEVSKIVPPEAPMGEHHGK